jgi:hypothetical protein
MNENNEMERIRKEAAVTYSKVTPQNFPGGSEK